MLKQIDYEKHYEAEKKGKQKILDFVREYGCKPSSYQISLSPDCFSTVSGLFDELLSSHRIIKHTFDTSKFVTVEQALEAMQQTGFREYTVG